MDEAFARRVGVDERLKDFGFDDRYQPPSTIKQVIKDGLLFGMRDEGQSVRYAMRAMTRVQTREPLGERKLIEFCLGLPPEQFMYRGQDRRLIKRMMASRLPAEILEAPHGHQGADWHLRVTRKLSEYREELRRLADDPEVASRVDIARLQRVIDTWPTNTPVRSAHHADYLIATFGLTRGLATARFIRWVNGGNA